VWSPLAAIIAWAMRWGRGPPAASRRRGRCDLTEVQKACAFLLCEEGAAAWENARQEAVERMALRLETSDDLDLMGERLLGVRDLVVRQDQLLLHERIGHGQLPFETTRSPRLAPLPGSASRRSCRPPQPNCRPIRKTCAKEPL
jgi:hypothetical protein